MYKVAIVGLGDRGYRTYAQYQKVRPDIMKIVAVADIDAQKVEQAKSEFGLDDKNCFSSAEELFKENKLADVVFIATQDKDHMNHSLMALEKDYDILLEKPIATNLKECITLHEAVHKSGRLVAVCHVLRYTKFFQTIKSVIDSGNIGDVAAIVATENVGYWHQAHSFVRGNWNNSHKTSPMILQKCCHDFDILSYLTDKKCISLNSYGSLLHFREENKPEGAALYCVDCSLKKTCPYSAELIYLDSLSLGIKSGNVSWPCNTVVDNPTEQKMLKALDRGKYGKCVYSCDNDVVDHQTVNILFESEITASFTMTGFTEKNYREINIMGTKGEIRANQDTNIISVIPFGKAAEVFDINKIADDLSGHGGGDNQMLYNLFDALSNKSKPLSTIDKSMQSHYMAFAAEYSRLNDGENINIESFVNANK